MIKGSNNPFACDPALISTQNQIITETGFTLVDNDFTINANWSWSLFGNTITNPSPIVRNIPFAATGMHRIDIIVLNNTTAVRIAGEEVSVGSPRAEPLTPPGAIRVTAIPVNDDSFGEIIPPVIGSLYIEKKEKTEITDASAGAIDFDFVDQRAVVVFTGSVTMVNSVNLDASTNYQHKKYTYINRQTTPITLGHLTGDGTGNNFNHFFPNEQDFVIQPNEIFEFLQTKTSVNNNILEFVGRAELEIDNVNGLQDALDLKADISYVDSLVVGLWDDRGSYDASTNAFPSTGGSGTSGAIKKGDIWTISVAGTLPSGQDVEIGDTVRALVDSPSTTPANWSILQNNIGYTPENSVNKATTMTGNTTSNVVFLTAKAIYDWAVALFVPQSRTITINGTALDLTANRSWTVGGSDYLLYKKKWIGFRLNTINTWRAPQPTYDNYDNAIPASYGTGSTPNSTFYLTGGWDGIPTGYLIDSIELEINFNLENSGLGAVLQVMIDVSEKASASLSNGSVSTINIVNETVTITGASNSLKFIKTLTVASHSLPTLAKSISQISVRETLSTDAYYSLGFNFIYKKQ